MTSTGAEHISMCTFDSELFGFPVGTLQIGEEDDLSAVLSQAKRAGFKLLYWRFPSSQGGLRERALQAGAFDSGNIISFSKTLPSETTPHNSFVHMYEQKDVAPLLQLAYVSGHASRFRTDPHFAPGSFEKMYGSWIWRYVQKEKNTALYIYSEDEHIAGFIGLEMQEHRTDIGLIAVDAVHRRKGIARSLIQTAMQQASEQQCAELHVRTQEQNVAACAMYRELGFVETESTAVLHIWL